jgi:NadR type nicotinamide-nucleotide adenylyltransferase
MEIIKIAIIGPESTGKTTLAKGLAKYFTAAMVPEFARDYLEGKGSGYTYEDLRKIAEGQLRLEDEVVSSLTDAGKKKAVFLDTELTVIRVWSEVVFGRCDHLILSAIAAGYYDHYLLTFPDLTWEPDPLREYPDGNERMRHFNYYLDSIINQQVPFSIIRGQGEERMQEAVRAVSYLFQ